MTDIPPSPIDTDPTIAEATMAPEAAPLLATAAAQAATVLMPWRRMGWVAMALLVALTLGGILLVRRRDRQA